MRGLHAMVKSAALAAIALTTVTAWALAQETMTFRPLSADSVAAIEARRATAGDKGSIEIHVDDHGAGKGLHIRIDSTRAEVSLPGTLPTPESPETPETPETPESPRGASRETTSDIVRIGGDVHVTENQVVDGDVVSIGGSVRVDGTVRGSVTSTGGDVMLGSTARIDRDVVCLGGVLHEEPGATIAGQRVTGRMPGSRLLLPMLSVVGTGVKVMTHLATMLFMLAIAFVIVKLAPGRTRAALDMIREEGAGSFLVGLLLWGLLIPSVVVLAIAMVILCITIIGIPLAIAVAIGYAAFIVLAVIWGSVVGYTTFGGLLHHRFQGQPAEVFRSAAWGIVGIYGLRIAADLLHVVPVFGFLGGLVNVLAIATTAVLGTLGAGALVRAEYRRRTVQDWWVRSRPGRGARPAEDAYPPPPASPPPPPPAPASPATEPPAPPPVV